MKRRTNRQSPRSSRRSRPESSHGLSPLHQARLEFTLEALCPGISLMPDELGFDCLYSIFCRVPTRELEISIHELIMAFCLIRRLEVRYSACDVCGGPCECGNSPFSLWSFREGRVLLSYLGF